MFVEEREDRRGRPRKMPSSKRGMNYSVYLDSDQVEIIHELRLKDDISVSAVIRNAVELYIEHKSKKIDYTLDSWQEDPNYRAIPELLAERRKWDKYIQEYADDKDLIAIAAAAKYIKDEVGRRRLKEHVEQQKQNSGIWRHYNNKK
jgi:hypothetical protein